MAVVMALPARRSRTSALSMAALGIGLVVLIGITWGTGLIYITSRAGFPSPVRLALIDSVHIYVGLAAAVFFGLKVWRVGFRTKVVGVPNLTLWQRWVSWSLLILYPAIFLTGFAAVLPLGAAWKESLVQAHLLTSVWSLVPTTLHLIHHRARATGRLKVRSLRTRLWTGIAMAALPAVLWLPFPRAVSPATEAGAGAAWVPAGLQGIYVDQVAVSPDGTHLVAAGDGVYVSDARGRSWHHLDLGGPPPGGHTEQPVTETPVVAGGAPLGHGDHSVPPGAISTLTLARGPVAIYAGSSAGLFSSADASSPLTLDHFPGGEVRSIAVDPRNPFERWVASGSGVWFTWVFGHGWTKESSGLSNPHGASALTFYRDSLYASDLAAVYRWEVALASWKKVLDETGVISLTSSRDVLIANSYTSGMAIYDGRSWRQVASGLTGSHAHGSGSSPRGIGVSAPRAGGLFVVQPGRVGFSSDAGRSWSNLGRGLPDGTWDVTRYGDRVYVATSDGLYSYTLETAPQDSPSWWVVMLGVALGAGVVAVEVAASPAGIFRRRRPRSDLNPGLVRRLKTSDRPVTANPPSDT